MKITLMLKLKKRLVFLMVKVDIERKLLRKLEELINHKSKHRPKEVKMRLKFNMKLRKIFLMVKVDLRNNG